MKANSGLCTELKPKLKDFFFQARLPSNGRALEKDILNCAQSKNQSKKFYLKPGYIKTVQPAK